MADSEEKLCSLVSEFGGACERRKLRVAGLRVCASWCPAERGCCVCKSKVMRCSRYGNGDRMHVILNGEPLEEVDFLGTWGRKWQPMEDVKGM